MRRKIIDISVGISSDTCVYPGDPETLIESVYSIRGDGYAVSRVSFGTHTGTHVDAPSHIIDGGPNIDNIPIESFVDGALVLDLSFVSTDISLDDLVLAFAGFEGYDASDVRVLLIKTHEYAHEDPDETPFTAQRCLQSDAGSWIMEHGFRAVGVDTLSVDVSQSLNNHRLFLENGVIIVENLDLSGVEPGLYDFICLPLKLHGCEAAPARVVLVEKGFLNK
ncbi:cyclase family protein [Methanolobus halotolerans]|uniref:Metal-dependent hydrolase n=1 Tax=Methanolobus halotolerans TaxID=2052935 RepID=A0A4E0QDA9_9EURY|nr:cyclase family protein [Methanolobus halotolerans]TGC11361.1 metal-dependent hydrolase [Methanolobus halotolerans]